MFRSLIPHRVRPSFPATPRFLNRWEQEMENLMGRYFGEDGGWLTPEFEFVPTINLVETENLFEVTVDLPGLKPEEVNVELKNGELWISGKREEEKEEKGKTLHRIERRHGEFRRVLSLPSTINEEMIEGKFENGVLHVTIPKMEEVKPKKIEVKV